MLPAADSEEAAPSEPNPAASSLPVPIREPAKPLDLRTASVTVWCACASSRRARATATNCAGQNYDPRDARDGTRPKEDAR